MTTDSNSRSNEDSPCSSRTRAFEDYGIEDGVHLVHRVYYHHLDNDEEFEPTGEFFDHLDTVFRTEFVKAGNAPTVPEPVVFAIEDAITRAASEFDDPDADLRYEVLPGLYRTVADRFCRYRRSYPGDGVAIDYDEEDDDGGVPVTID